MSDKQEHPSKQCMTEGCGKDQKWKGLCRSCYGQALRLIEEQQTTWDELATMGLVRIEDKPFKAAFLRKKTQTPTDNH